MLPFVPQTGGIARRYDTAASLYIMKQEQPPIERRIQLGHALYEQSRYLEAVAVLDGVLQMRPDLAGVWNDRGIMLRTLTRFDAALKSYDKAIELSPDYWEAHYNKGATLDLLSRRDEALTSYDSALSLKPDFATGWNNRGSVLLALGRAAEAVGSYDRAIALFPSYAEAFGNRAAALTQLGRHSDALTSADTAIELQAAIAIFYDHRGTALANLHRHAEALSSYDQAIALRPDFAGAYSNRASVLLNLNRPEDAIASCDRALAIDPASAEACNNRGAALTELGRFAEALTSFQQSTILKPDYAAAWANCGMLLLLTGQTADGWAAYRQRERLAWKATPYANMRPWSCGEDIKGKVLFIEAVDGLGDAIQFCRRIRQLEAQGGKVICALPPALHGLLKDISPTARFVDAPVSFVDAERHVSLYNLAEGFPPIVCAADTPYLKADEGRVRQWKNLLGDSGFKVGICWQGSFADTSRSFPVSHFRCFSDIPDLRLISLQKGPAVKQLADLPPDLPVETLGDSFDAGPDAFMDTAAVMENLDLIIAPDTAVAHLAGALGRPVWVALKHIPDWRWSLNRSDSPWYPSMRLFRQHTYGDWSVPFAEMSQHLAEWLNDQ
jgi:tetratricopeptide (TPR) repeat protein